MAEVAERRDRVARVARNRLAHMLGVHPRQLRMVDVDLAFVIAQHLNQSNRQIKRLVDQSTVDELTGSLRRAAGLEALDRELNRARRVGDDHLVVAFVDLDSLKRVNDSAGHAAGDRLLIEVGKTLRARLRAYDLVIRWGGDEFVCVLPEAGLKGASRILSEIIRDFQSSTGQAFSVGFAELEELGDSEGAAELVARADASLYAARRIRDQGPPPRFRHPFILAGAASAAAVACLVAGLLAGSASPISSLWIAHQAVDSVRTAISTAPAQTELQLAQERAKRADQTPPGPDRQAWIQNALSHLQAAARDGASSDSVDRLRNVISTVDSKR